MAANRSNEAGFVLMGAIWLLILCGSIASVLMLRSLERAKSASAQEQALEARLALDGAVDLIAADLLFNGRRSYWRLLPASARISAAGVPVHVKLSSESGRLDLNSADPALIDTALRSFGMAPAERQRFLARLAAARAADRPLASIAEMRSLLANLGEAADICLTDQFTPMSAARVPRPEHMPVPLARALGIAADPRARAEPERGANLRIEARLAGGEALTAIVRMAATRERPYATSAWEYVAFCPDGAGSAG